MEIKLHEIEIRDVCNGYKDSQENGVVGYGGKLNIRPAFQREFVYNEKQRNAVIETVMKGFPLNVMYWVVDENENYELLDGQQRTFSICQYVNGDFSVKSFAVFICLSTVVASTEFAFLTTLLFSPFLAAS